MDTARRQNHSKNFPIATTAIKPAAVRVRANSTEDIARCSFSGVPSALMADTRSKHCSNDLERCTSYRNRAAIIVQLISNHLDIQRPLALTYMKLRFPFGRIRTLDSKSNLFDLVRPIASATLLKDCATAACLRLTAMLDAAPCRWNPAPRAGCPRTTTDCAGFPRTTTSAGPARVRPSDRE